MDSVVELTHPVCVAFLSGKNYPKFCIRSVHFAGFGENQIYLLEMDPITGKFLDVFSSPDFVRCFFEYELPEDWTEICQKTLETKAKS